MFIRKSGALIALLLVSILFTDINMVSKSVLASEIYQRSITLSSAVPSDTATHTFQFTVPSTTSLGSIVLQYCSNSPLPSFACTAPAGMDATSAILSSQTGNVGFSIDNGNSSANKLVLTRIPANGIIAPSSYVFSGVINPSTAGQIVYVRISTHVSTDGSGGNTDFGAVAFNVSTAFNVGAYVPPFLNLCVGISVAPDCTSQTGDSLDLGIFTTNAARFGQSQFSTATNDPSGYVIYALGTTMTSGNNIIPSVPNLAPSFPGTGQFGINLRANLIPSIGQDPVGVGTGAPTPNYNVSNRYSFNTGDSIASANLPSNYNRMTVSYLVNVPSKQPPGIYSTTVTYVATVQF